MAWEAFLQGTGLDLFLCMATFSGISYHSPFFLHGRRLETWSAASVLSPVLVVLSQGLRDGPHGLELNDRYWSMSPTDIPVVLDNEND